MTIKSLNKGLQVQSVSVDSMIAELMEREEFTGGGSTCQSFGCPAGFACGNFDCVSGFDYIPEYVIPTP